MKADRTPIRTAAATGDLGDEQLEQEQPADVRQLEQEQDRERRDRHEEVGPDEVDQLGPDRPADPEAVQAEEPRRA